ncbi:MAG: M42 family metallopeptidase [bacterium]
MKNVKQEQTLKDLKNGDNLKDQEEDNKNNKKENLISKEIKENMNKANFEFIDFRKYFNITDQDIDEFFKNNDSIDINLLASLSNAFGVSNFEDDVKNIITDFIESHGYEYSVDLKGNIVVFKDIPDEEFKVALVSHIDEVGFIVSEKVKHPYVKVEPIGGWDIKNLLSSKVIIKTRSGYVKGVFASLPPHIKKDFSIKEFSDLYVDVDCNYDVVDVGDPLVLESYFEVISPYSVMGKAFDNRVGTYINLHLLRNIEPFVDVLHIFTVQEELGLRGSRFILNNQRFRANLIIVLETTSGESPYTDSQVSYVSKGPVLTIMDKSYIANPKLVDFVKFIANSLDIPLQIKKPNIGGTDAGYLQDLANTIIISVPSKYIHTNYQIVHLTDIQNTIRLVKNIIQNADFIKYLKDMQI